MTTLVEFLLARIAEDEAAARVCDPRDWPVRLDDDGVSYRSDIPDAEQPYFAQGDLLNRFTPAYVLAECEAKRRIIAEHKHEAVFDTVGCVTCHSDNELGTIGVGWCDTLRLLALPYEDHPDWREEWRP